MLKSKYYKQPLDEQKMLYGAMSGLTAALGDPYTVFSNQPLRMSLASLSKENLKESELKLGLKKISFGLLRLCRKAQPNVPV